MVQAQNILLLFITCIKSSHLVNVETLASIKVSFLVKYFHGAGTDISTCLLALASEFLKKKAFGLIEFSLHLPVIFMTLHILYN